MNHLFNTGFAVLDATSGIHQTTLGIWASPGDTKNILVLDVEGKFHILTYGSIKFGDLYCIRY